VKAIRMIVIDLNNWRGCFWPDRNVLDLSVALRRVPGLPPG